MRAISFLVGYIVNTPWSLVGIAWAVVVLGGRKFTWADGTLQIRCKRIIPAMATAQTWGWVIFVHKTRWPLASRVRLNRHELGHADDFRKVAAIAGATGLWFYAFYQTIWIDLAVVVTTPAMYGLATLFAIARGGHYYHDNEFERRAERAEEIES